MKFTEEQFKKLVEIQEYQYCDNLYMEPKSSTKAIKHAVEKYDPELHDFICEKKLGNEVVALMNPLTREWAHDKFVEKEKRYVWHSKKNNVHGKPVRLFKGAGQDVRSFPANWSDMVAQDEHLTESEIREWGYDPERFDKEEVE